MTTLSQYDKSILRETYKLYPNIAKSIFSKIDVSIFAKLDALSDEKQMYDNIINNTQTYDDFYGLLLHLYSSGDLTRSNINEALSVYGYTLDSVMRIDQIPGYTKPFILVSKDAEGQPVIEDKKQYAEKYYPVLIDSFFNFFDKLINNTEIISTFNIDTTTNTSDESSITRKFGIIYIPEYAYKKMLASSPP